MATVTWPSTLADILVSDCPMKEKGLIGWWPCNYTYTSSYVLDMSGNSVDLGINGSVSLATGISGYGAQFDGSSAYLVSTDDLTVTGDFSVSFWAKYTTLSGIDTIFRWGAGTNTNGIYLLSGSSSEVQSLVFCRDAAVETITDVFSLTTSLQHIGITYDYSEQEYIVYINGVRITSGILSNQMVPPDGVLYLGAYSAATYLFNGLVDEFRLYDRVLTSQEMSSLYSSPSPYEALPLAPLQDGYTRQKASGLLRTDMDVGPPKTRRRYTAVITDYSLQYAINFNQEKILDNFYDIQCVYGSLPFNWQDPITGESVEAQFMERPSYTPNNSYMIASISLQVLP